MTLPHLDQAPKPRRRRRWPWITGAAVLVVFVLAAIFGNSPQPTGAVPASDTGTLATSQSIPAPVSSPTTTTPPPVTTTTTTTTTPITTTPVAVHHPATAPRTTTRAAAVAPVHHKTTKPAPPTHRTTTTKPKPPTHHKPVPKPTEPAQPAPGRYHAGEFCSTLGATAISSTGASMTCIQEGKYKRWHNN
jgi:hypothetical protein